jgi:hypothetical protein
MKGLYITPAGANGNGSQIVQATAGDAISLQARVYNYSLAVMPPGSTVHVRFYGQEWDEDKADFTGAAFVIDEVRLGPIPPFNPSSGEPNWVLAGTTLDTTSYADQYLIFWVVVWMSRTGRWSPADGHGLTAIPGTTTAPTAVAIERYSNNVGLTNSPSSSARSRAGGWACRQVWPASPSPCRRWRSRRAGGDIENVTVTATRRTAVSTALVVYYDGDPQQGGQPFDTELIPYPGQRHVCEVSEVPAPHLRPPHGLCRCPEHGDGHRDGGSRLPARGRQRIRGESRASGWGREGKSPSPARCPPPGRWIFWLPP